VIELRYLTISCLVGLAVAFPARAEEAGVIVVTGEGLETTPASPAYDVQTIEREQILTSASGRIEDVLSSIAGFQQFRRSDSRSANPSAQGATLRALGGNATSRALVLLDGVPLADPMFGYIPFGAIDPARIGAIRVTRGGGSGAFGAGAVAGTIELDSAGPAQIGPLFGEASVNDRGETSLSAVAAPQLGQGFAVAGVRWDRGQGFWTTPADQRVPASARAANESWSASLRGAAPLAPALELQARVMAFDDRRTLRFVGADSSSSGQDANLRLVGRGAWQIDALAYVQLRNFTNVVISSGTFRRVLDQRRTPSTGLGGKLEVRPPLGEDHVLRLGVDWRLARGELQEEAYNAGTGALTARRRAGGFNTDVGLFGEFDWTLGDLALTAGLRADRWSITEGFYREVNAAGAPVSDLSYPDRSGWTVTWRAGAVWQAGTGLRLRAAGYSGLRLPTLNELYRPFVVFPVVTQANAALKPERLIGYEAGFDWTPTPGVDLALTAFDNRVEDAIANVTVAPNLRQRRNVDALRARGIEATAKLQAGQFRFVGSLALTDAEIEARAAAAALDGMRPAQTPRLAASATLAWEPRRGWRLAATARHVGAQFEDDLQTELLPAATTLDLFAEVPVGERVSLVLRGENVTDAEVITRSQGGSIDLGAPRTVWAGLRVSLAP
jgi:vitamin B12 transporter